MQLYKPKTISSSVKTWLLLSLASQQTTTTRLCRQQTSSFHERLIALEAQRHKQTPTLAQSYLGRLPDPTHCSTAARINNNTKLTFHNEQSITQKLAISTSQLIFLPSAPAHATKPRHAKLRLSFSLRGGFSGSTRVPSLCASRSPRTLARLHSFVREPIAPAQREV